MARVHIGGLGQDDGSSFITDFGVPGSITEPISPALYSETPAPVDTSIYDIQYGSPGVAPTASTYEQQAAVAAGQVAPSSSWYSGLTSAVSNLFAAKPTAPAPRVSTTAALPTQSSLLTSSSMIAGIPDIYVLGVLGVAAVLIFSGGKRRR